MDIKNGFTMIKDIADAGYKIKVKEYNAFVNENFPEMTGKNMFKKYLVIGVNIITQYKNAIIYNNNKEMVLSQLSVMDCLEEMTEEEQKMYSNNPTGLNAILITVKNSQPDNVITLKLDKKSIIKIKITEKIDDFEIISTKGPVAKLSLEEQRKEVMKAFKAFKKGFEEGTLELKGHNKEQKEAMEDLQKSNQIQELNDLKSELLKTKEEQVTNNLEQEAKFKSFGKRN